MHQTPGGMAGAGIVMCPVDDTALGAPLILAFEGDRVTNLQGFDFRGDVDIVSDQQGLPGLQFDDKPLMSASLSVVTQHLGHGALTLERSASRLGFQGLGKLGVGVSSDFDRGSRVWCQWCAAALHQSEDAKCDNGDNRQEFLHEMRNAGCSNKKVISATGVCGLRINHDVHQEKMKIPG